MGARILGGGSIALVGGRVKLAGRDSVITSKVVSAGWSVTESLDVLFPMPTNYVGLARSRLWKELISVPTAAADWNCFDLNLLKLLSILVKMSLRIVRRKKP